MKSKIGKATTGFVQNNRHVIRVDGVTSAKEGLCQHVRYIYRLRHLVENAFLKLKRLRAVATRYAKTTSSFRGAVVLASILQWLRLEY